MTCFRKFIEILLHLTDQLKKIQIVNVTYKSVVASIASDPKVWDAVMENKDLMKFLETNTASTKDEADNDDKSELSSETESEEDSEAKPIQLMEILRDMKLRAVQMMENVSSYFGGLFRTETFTEGGQERKRMLLNDPTTLFGLAVCVIFMGLLSLAGFEEDCREHIAQHVLETVDETFKVVICQMKKALFSVAIYGWLKNDVVCNTVGSYAIVERKLAGIQERSGGASY
ncbi:hypothetical protein F2Q69_00043621 [Brassica cretica]|uniref:Uncharacterized protein n=1 Tax=Brassica cretica TaxID=69181 RepID=A0A8S9NGW6_BRACR|nr:hypothetical protein F2Q69_00043621 [Brassica cretica]